ncbi:MAG: 2-amino-4-hydroxy-6-hydroxymethyldihydropteridine diphosphokinase [Gammaproteobacteria bacterium]|jgi:2-amino-4-hydroxy-6-hydroxymethyldihydropteridine diphosphokinase
MTVAYIGLGSNLDDPRHQVRSACVELAAVGNLQFIAVSSLYRSAPLGPTDQPDYVNAVAEIATSLTAQALLDVLQHIENSHGRQRGEVRWGPRTLDLDILLFGEKIINSDRLTIPHPGLYERPFVLYPLQEIAPALVVPGRGPLTQLIQSCPRGRLEKIGRIMLPVNNNDNETQL